MHSARELQGLDLSSIRTRVTTLAKTTPEEPSHLYSPDRDARFMDEDLRRSTSRLYKDDELFDLVERHVITAQLNNGDFHFGLARNDAMHIVYPENGGFFAIHSDFLSYESNVLEEFTLLLCLLDPNDESNNHVEGGETKLQFNALFSLTSKTTTTPNCALLFRKDIMHEGLPLRKGRKEILALNLLATRKDSPQILVVSFPNNAAPAVTTTTTTTTTANLPSSATIQQDQSPFIIPTRNLKDFPMSFLCGLVGFGEGNDDPEKEKRFVIHYECTVVSREVFQVVYRAICRMVLTVDEVATHAETLDFFGIPHQLILVDSLVNTANPKDTPVAKAGGLAKKKSPPHLDISLQQDVIVCSSLARTQLLTQQAIEQGLPWIPFRIVFCETDVFGASNYAGMRPNHVPMQPVFASLGSYDNMLFVRSVTNAHGMPDITISLDALHDQELSFMRFIAKSSTTFDWKKELDQPGNALSFDQAGEPGARDEQGRVILPFEIDEWDHGHKCARHMHLMAFHLRVAPVNGFNMETVARWVGDEMSEFNPEAMIVLPGAGMKAGVGPNQVGTWPCFHVDSQDRVCFSKEEASQAETRFMELDVLDKCMSIINEVGWQFPQERFDLGHNYCNESVYGKTKLIEITGMFYAPPMSIVAESMEFEDVDGEGSEDSGEYVPSKRLRGMT